MKIVIDVYGCDNPDRVIKGCVKAIREIDDVCLILVGKENEIIEKIKNEDFDKKRIEIINADEVITNNESPSVAIRQKRNSSLRVAYKTLKENDECLAMITCGSTGAVIIGSIMCLGKEEGVERPALATLLPCTNGKFSCLVDCGANVDTKPNQLVQFAKSAIKYMQRSFRINNPSVALLSVGTEDAKGNILTKETFTLLKESNMNFVGNMEAKTVLSGDVDIIVSDGFAGNVLLKSIEGVSKSVMSTFVSLLYKYCNNSINLSFVEKALYEFNKIYDFNSVGGAFLLGTKKLVIKGHGSANENTIVNTVKQAIKYYEVEK